MLRLVTVVVAGFCALAAAEGLIRLLGLLPQQRLVVLQDADELAGDTNESDIGRLVVHPYRGFTPRPGFDTEETSRWASRSNTFGIRSLIDDPRNLSEDDFVVGIFGGSVARGTSFRGREALRSAILEVFPEQRENLRIVNFAVSGYKQPQQLFLLSELLLLGVPIDVVVNIDGFNEIAVGGTDAVRGSHPLYPERNFWLATISFGSGALSPRQIELTAKTLSLRRSADQSRGFFHRLSFLRRSALVQAGFGTYVIGAERRAVEAEEALRDEPSPEIDRSVFALPSPPCDIENDDCHKLIAAIWRSSSVQMAALARASQATYVHILQPNQYVSDSKIMSQDELSVAWAPHRPWSQAATAGYTVLQRAGVELSAEGVNFHDASMIFADRRETIYSDICCHFNDLGYDIFARRIGFEISEAVRAHETP